MRELDLEKCNNMCVCVADPAVIAKHQPMVWGTDRIDGAYSAISSLGTKPSYLLTFNEPNYAFGGGTPSNVVDPVTAAGLWPELMSKFNPMGIQLIAPSAIDCAGDGNCHNVGTAAGWLSQFRDVGLPYLCLDLHRPASKSALCANACRYLAASLRFACPIVNTLAIKRLSANSVWCPHSAARSQHVQLFFANIASCYMPSDLRHAWCSPSTK